MTPEPDAGTAADALAPDVEATLIDCDVHNVVGPVQTLEPYLDDHWREVIATSQFAGPTDQAHPPNLATSRRDDLDGAGDEAPGRAAATVGVQLLDPLRIAVAVLSCDYGVESVRNPDAAAALARAVNDWQAAEWLDVRRPAARLDCRLRAAAERRDQGARAPGRRPAIRRGLPAGPVLGAVRQPDLVAAVGGDRAS